jgi:VIT1/CCC1 family predicted Fe2+/Mn2+ transporter
MNAGEASRAEQGTETKTIQRISLLRIPTEPHFTYLFIEKEESMSQKELHARLLDAQRSEITEYHIYHRLARLLENKADAEILRTIADDELKHYEIIKEQTMVSVSPSRWRIWFYPILARVFGYTFALRLMENREDQAQINYQEVAETFAPLANIERDEFEHEQKLIAMLDEERLKYASSMVLGLNDALVELTGAMAGLTLALQKTQLIALTGAITGIAASLSMAASEYLSTKTDVGSAKNPLKAATYTGTAYFMAVLVLILPFLLLDNLFLALTCTLAGALLVILFFTFYISVAKGKSFKRSYVEMAAISMGVAAASFFIGLFVRRVMGVDV